MRIAICQAVLPAYRIPVFQQLGRQRDTELTVFASEGRGSIHSVAAGDAFCHVPSRVYHFSLLGREFRFQPAQFRVMNPRLYDVVILSWDIHYLSLVPALLLARWRKIPTILWGHGYSQNPNPLTETLRNAVGKMADAVLLYNQTVAKRLIEQGFDKEKVFVAQNALDQAPIQQAKQAWLQAPERLADFRAKWQLDPAQTVIFVSRLEAANRADMLISALQRLRNTRPQAKLVIVGNGPDRERLQALVKSLDQANQVIFTGAIYDDNELAPWMLSATVFAYPVNIGLSLLHAFGYGLPVVTSGDIAHQGPEIGAFMDNETGLFYLDGDVESLAKQWQRIFADPMLQKRMADQALRQVSDTYNLETMIKGFMNVITAVTTNPQTTVRSQ